MTTATKVGKAAKTTAAAAGNPFDAFNFSVPSVEVPASFRDFAEKSVAQARDAYAKLKTAAEDATDMVEDTFETAREGAFNLSVKAIDAAKNNSDASFALARELFGAKTFAEVIELQTAFTRKTFDTVAAQAKEFQELAQKFVADTSKPVTARVEKTFKDMKAA
jgi:phasin